KTGYGYIEAQGSDVLRFIEKPALEKAQEYVASGRFLWNSGMFCFSARTILQEMRLHCPSIVETVETSLDRSHTAKDLHYRHIELSPADFARVPEDSLDYAVMEKTARAAVVSCAMGWNDIGSWAALCELVKADGHDNRIEAQVVLRDTSN